MTNIDTIKDFSLIQIAQMGEDEAREFLEAIRWSEGVYCPHCGSLTPTRMQGKKHRKGAFQCNDCRKQFTVTVGTIMHRSKLPLVKWIMAFFLMCSSKKGISALQLQRQLGLKSYQTAWHLCHRIRYAMERGEFGQVLGTEERNNNDVHDSAPDELKGVGAHLLLGHHSDDEVNREDESYVSLVKRAHVGAYHCWSKKHAHRYCAEFDFRWSHRKATDAERTVEAIQGSEGKRLPFHETDEVPGVSLV